MDTIYVCVPSSVEIVPCCRFGTEYFLKFKVIKYVIQFGDHRFMEKDVTLLLKKISSLLTSPIDNLCRAWLILARWSWRRNVTSLQSNGQMDGKEIRTPELLA